MSSKGKEKAPLLQEPTHAVNVLYVSDDPKVTITTHNKPPKDGICENFKNKMTELLHRKPSQKRLVEKDGHTNVRAKDIPRTRYLEDIFTTAVNMRWKWVSLIFLLAYLGSWLFFGGCWWVVGTARNWHVHCFTNVRHFTDAFLLSVETQVTIGWGGRTITGNCPETVVLLVIQCMLGLLIDAVLLGLIFARIASPKKRRSTVLFSENAVITKRDGKFCFMFQVADVRKKQLASCVMRLHLVRKYVTKEGKVIQGHQDQLRVGFDWVNIRDDSDRALPLYPATICHVIDSKSPLYNMSPEKIGSTDWEFIVLMEGTVGATGTTLQAKTSYLAKEIAWGYDFIDIIKDEDWDERRGLMYLSERLSRVEPAKYVPLCSPKEYYSREGEPEDVCIE